MNFSSTYKNGREHLREELQKLDARLHLQVVRSRKNLEPDRPDQLRGLYITDGEIDRVLEKQTLPKENPKEEKKLLQYIEKIKTEIPKRIAKSSQSGIFLPLHRIAAMFGLSPFETETLLICSAPELDAKYEKMFAYLQDDVTKRLPTVNLVLDLLCDTPTQRHDARVVFNRLSPLMKNHLLCFADDEPHIPLLSRSLKTDTGIVDFLLELNTLHPRLSPFTQILPPLPDWSEVIMEEETKKQFQRLQEHHFEQSATRPLVLYFYGPNGGGKRMAAQAFCGQAKIPLLRVDVHELLQQGDNIRDLVEILFREPLLHPSAVYLHRFDHLASPPSPEKEEQFDYIRGIIIKTIESTGIITFLSGEKPWNPVGEFRNVTFMRREFPVPGFQQRKLLWRANLKEPGQLDIDELANKFRFTGGQIRDALEAAHNNALVHGNGGQLTISMNDLYEGCRAQSNRKLAELAQKIIPRYTWDDIVLPTDKLSQLKEIYNHVKFRHTVYYEWGFDKKFSLGKGVNVLFSGASGTGKTMASEIIANQLSMELYKIDLSSVVSKYIGETEKNLDKIFREAETANAILLFDEADALFGKRSEVKDAHDRYANIETNFLLQKMEEHEGIVILTTNFKKNIDEAFTRRFRFTVEFPFPDTQYRLRIWQQIFPQRTPLEENLDFSFLAGKFRITGGNIKNIALNTAFLAAADGRVVQMGHLVKATQREIRKMGEFCAPSDFGKYAPMAT